MGTTLTGALSWLLNACVAITTGCILLVGTWIILNAFVWNLLVPKCLRYLKLYGLFVHFIMYRRGYFKWAKRNEGRSLDDAAND